MWLLLLGIGAAGVGYAVNAKRQADARRAAEIAAAQQAQAQAEQALAAHLAHEDRHLRPLVGARPRRMYGRGTNAYDSSGNYRR